MLSLTVRLTIIKSALTMKNAVRLAKASKIIADEKRTVIRHNLFPQPKERKYFEKSGGRRIRCGSSQWNCFGVLGVGVNLDRQSVTEDRTSEINVNPQPWTSRELRWIKLVLRRIVNFLLAIIGLRKTFLLSL